MTGFAHRTCGLCVCTYVLLMSCTHAAFYAFRDAHQQSATSAGRLYEQLQQLVAQAEELVEPNAFGAMLQRSGAVGLNATTGHDATKYFMSLPANMLELWFALEAERFQVHLRELAMAMYCFMRLPKPMLAHFRAIYMGKCSLPTMY